jgi:uncharacterized membrane protein
MLTMIANNLLNQKIFQKLGFTTTEKWFKISLTSYQVTNVEYLPLSAAVSFL